MICVFALTNTTLRTSDFSIPQSYYISPTLSDLKLDFGAEKPIFLLKTMVQIYPLHPPHRHPQAP